MEQQNRIQFAIGARAAAKLSREIGGASAYVRVAKANYTTITAAERERVCVLYEQGHYAQEIAAITGRSISSIGPIISCARMDGRITRLPKPSSFEGKVVRRELRAGKSLAEARTIASAEFRQAHAKQIEQWERQYAKWGRQS